jgi:hypothetical protein
MSIDISTEHLRVPISCYDFQRQISHGSNILYYDSQGGLANSFTEYANKILENFLKANLTIYVALLHKDKT